MAVILPNPYGTYTLKHRALGRDSHQMPVPGAVTVIAAGIVGRTRTSGDQTVEITLDPSVWPAADVATLAQTTEVLVTGPDPAGVERTWVLQGTAYRRGVGPAHALSHVQGTGLRTDL